jgi:hypothetical protein
LQARLDSSDQALIRARQQADDARRAADRCDHDKLQPAQDKLNQAAARASAAQAKVDELRDKERDLLERLAKLPADRRGESERRRLEQRLEQVRQRLKQARNKAKRLAREEQRAQEQRNQAASQCASKLSSAEQALAQAQKLNAERDRDAEQLSRAQTQLATTPSHDTVEVIDTFRFPVKQVERSCAVQAALTLQPAWSSAETRRIDGRGKTVDRSHSGYPRYGVVADPLGFAHSDSELVSLASGDAAAAAVTSIRERARGYYAHMTEKALDMAHHDPHAATDLMLSMLLAAPGQLTEEHKQQLAQHLDQHYQLKDWRALEQ